MAKFEFSSNELMLLTKIFNDTYPDYCKYNGLDAALWRISSNHIWVCYFVGATYRYTDTRKLRLIQYIDNKYVKLDEATEALIRSRVHEFYYEYLPRIENEMLNYALENEFNSTGGVDTDIFKYKIFIVNGKVKIKFDYLS